MKPILYTQNGCRPCDMLKNFLQDNDLEVDVRNISENDEYKTEVKALNVMSTPVLVKGSQVLTGYTPAMNEEVLALFS
jgi:glutaredoxin-like protein NrdH